MFHIFGRVRVADYSLVSVKVKVKIAMTKTKFKSEKLEIYTTETKE
jgi:hypothetical protein